uniref:Protein arginine methyltransferase NDUFAF7 n=1 Tax=Solanum tuberosum TaxID=4113 RepID=M0ZLX4_SOLTU
MNVNNFGKATALLLRKRLPNSLFIISSEIDTKTGFNKVAKYGLTVALKPRTSSTSVEHLEDREVSTTPPSAAISIDRSGLYNPPEHSHEPSSGTELVKHLKSIIKFRGGPISVAEYMEEVLTNPKAGFYINRDVFGAEGDFITSPEVSQMFGEGASKFRNFTDSLHIHMVECSPTLKKLQYQNLMCINKNDTDGDAEEHSISRLTGTSVSWHATLEQVPAGIPTIIIAHEFYDALPVHQFQYREHQIDFFIYMQRASRGWCEKMVDVAENSMFQFVLSKQPTPATLYLLKRFKWAENEDIGKLEQVEVCPKAIELTQEIAKRIGSDGGGALIIDYGLNGIVSDSLQAIRKHGFVNILDDPGTADLSAYVDFAAIRHSAEEASDDVAVNGPMTQSQFLGSLGINFRVEALMENCTDEQADSLRTGYWRLVGEGEAPFWEGPEGQAPIGMGTRYLAMTIVNKKQGVPIPFQ